MHIAHYFVRTLKMCPVIIISTTNHHDTGTRLYFKYLDSIMFESNVLDTRSVKQEFPYSKGNVCCLLKELMVTSNFVHMKTFLFTITDYITYSIMLPISFPMMHLNL